MANRDMTMDFLKAIATSFASGWTMVTFLSILLSVMSIQAFPLTFESMIPISLNVVVGAAAAIATISFFHSVAEYQFIDNLKSQSGVLQISNRVEMLSKSLLSWLIKFLFALVVVLGGVVAAALALQLTPITRPLLIIPGILLIVLFWDYEIKPQF